MKKQPIKKKERRHSIENTKKVAVAVAKNPNGTLREIAKEAWVSHETVSTKLWQLWQLKEKWLEDLLLVDKGIIIQGAKEIKRRLDDEDEIKQLKATDISTLTKDSTARYMMFRWEATDEQGWLKDLSKMDNKQLDDYLKKLLD